MEELIEILSGKVTALRQHIENIPVQDEDTDELLSGIQQRVEEIEQLIDGR